MTLQEKDIGSKGSAMEKITIQTLNARKTSRRKIAALAVPDYPFAERVAVPVVGFGSGPRVDGQILLLHDLIGMFDAFTRKFSKQYLDIAGTVTKALGEFVQDVENGTFPELQHYAEMPREEGEKLRSALAAELR
jgi:ketopantoate hydroxymethyltransferase